MIGFIVKKFIGSKNDRELKKIRPLIQQITEREAEYQKLSDEELRANTAEFKSRVEEARKQQGYDEVAAQARVLESELRGDEARIERRKAFAIEQQILTELLPEAFAAVKNAC